MMYRHTYNCLLENKRNVSIFKYELHTQWPSGSDKRNIQELKKRVRINMIGITVKNVYHLRTKLL